MFTAIGLTLLFAAATSALGLRRDVHVYRSTGSRKHGLYPALTRSAMTTWFGIAGLWVLWR